MGDFREWAARMGQTEMRDGMTTTVTRTVLHPCLACGVNAPRAIDAPHTLCDNCAADLPATLEHVNAMLTAATHGLDRHREAWIARQVELPDDMAERWSRLCAARNAAEGAVIAWTRGRLAAAVAEETRQMKLEAARQRLATIREKIERTRVAVPPLAILLDQEQKMKTEEQRLMTEVERWSRAKQETEWAISGRPF